MIMYWSVHNDFVLVENGCTKCECDMYGSVHNDFVLVETGCT